MTLDFSAPLRFIRHSTLARFIDPSGQPVEKTIDIRTDPVSGRTARVTYARAEEKEPGIDRLPPPPPSADNTAACPFCQPQVTERTPRLAGLADTDERLQTGDSVLFPNLFPYGGYSAVSLFDDQHFVEIGTADPAAYCDCFVNCARYLSSVRDADEAVRFAAITQNHLPSAGGSLVHPHLQVHADAIAPNFVRFLTARTRAYARTRGSDLFSDYLRLEQDEGERLVGSTGEWQWLAAFAPEGFFELWAILPGVFSIMDITEAQWADLSGGVIRCQRFYRHLNRNGYNLGMISSIDPEDRLEIRLRIMVRSNYDQWVRSDHTGYEVMLGDMATFTAPEQTAEAARPFFEHPL